MRAIHLKDVTASAHDTAVVMHERLHAHAHLAQHVVGVRPSKALVDHGEVVDVDHDRVGRDAFVMLVVLLAVAVEELEVVQVRERVALGRLDDLAVLAQLDGTPDSGLHHAGIGIRLLDEVACPGVQAHDLLREVRGYHDDRNVAQLRRGLHQLQDLLSRHVRHDEIEQHERDGLSMSPHLLHGMLAVLGIEELVLVIEHRGKYLAVDRLVVDD